MLAATLKSCLRFGLGAVPTRVYQRLFPRDVIGLCYHMVTDEYPPHVAQISSYKTSAQFEADLQYLTKHYEVIGYEELRERRAENEEQRARKNGSTSPVLGSRLSALRPSFVLTFDDGYRECFDVVRPLLLKYEVPAIFFVTTDFIDNRHLFYRNKVSLCVDRILGMSGTERSEVVRRLQQHEIIDEMASSQLSPGLSAWLLSRSHRDVALIDEFCGALEIDVPAFLRERRPYLSKAEIESLHADGFPIGAHGRSHVSLGRLENEAELEAEITESCRIVREITRSEEVPFAFPFSGSRVRIDRVAEIRDRNRHVGMIFDSRGLLPNGPFLVHRVSSDDSRVREKQRSSLPRLISYAYQSQLRRSLIEPAKRKLAANSR